MVKLANCAKPLYFFYYELSVVGYVYCSLSSRYLYTIRAVLTQVNMPADILTNVCSRVLLQEFGFNYFIFYQNGSSGNLGNFRQLEANA